MAMKLRKRVEEIRKSTRKKRILLISVSFMIVLLILSFCIFQYQKYQMKKQREELILDIKKTYSKYMVSKKDTKLYTKKLKKVGMIKKGLDFQVEKEKKEDFEYFKIKGTNYYVFYQDVKKIDQLSAVEEYPNYLFLNQDVTTKKNTKLYLQDRFSLMLDQPIKAPIWYIDKKGYYIQYLDKTFRIKKEDIQSFQENKESKEEEADYISILNYNVLASKCNSRDCTTLQSLDEQINYLNTHGYYPITIEEYKNWLAGNIRFKKKAILLTTPNKTSEVDSLNEKYPHFFNIISSNKEITFIDNNKKTTKDSKLNQLSRYNVKKDTKLEDFEKMVLGEHVEEVVNTNSSDSGQRIPVLNYHFFYDGRVETCNENICLDVKNFKEQLDYLKSNQYKTLTMEEYRAWMYGELELPQKSVLITIDDGAFGTGRHNGNKLIPILEEYQMHATLFLIAGWWDINNYRSSNLDIESHTYDMHNTGSCGKAQVICANHDELLNDLQKSISIIGHNTAFCFPFYTYDEKSIQVVKEAGFKLSFVGGNRKSSRSDNKYKIPRYPIYKNTSMDQFIRMVN